MLTLYIMQGIPGSGKTTKARQIINELGSENVVRLNRDDFRNMLGDYWVPKREKLISEMMEDALLKSLDLGYDVIWDNMNLNEKDLNHIIKLTESTFNDIDIKYIKMKTSLEECIRRDSLREKPIGKETITSIYNKYYK